MADNKDKSRADDLFEILNAVHNEMDEENGGGSPSESEDTGSRIDEILEMLSSDEESSSAGNDFEDSDIPSSIFSHLSEEGETDSESHYSGNPHFTDDTSEQVPAEAPISDSEEEDEEDEEEEYEENSKLKAVGRFFRGMSFIPKAIIYIALVVIAAAYLSYYIITIGNDVFALVTDSREVTITIKENATDEEVAKLLKEKGIIEYDWVFELFMKYRNSDDEETEDAESEKKKTEYIPGDHTLNQNYNYAQIITSLTTGSITREVVRVTIPEGFTVNQIIDLLVEKGVGQRDDYIEAINNYPYKWDFVRQLEDLGYSDDRMYRLEGYLYPDTYDFYTTEDEVYVINKMLNAFNDRFWRDFTKKDEDGNSFQNQILEDYGMTFDDIIVLASLVQSEGGTAEDFYYVSYVFHNRLSHPESFPRMESDATIQYVLPERISDSTQLDVGYETPYNTYLYDGLPPGAISNPGLDALSATLFPEAPLDDNGREINAYYFVANNAGKTYYASTKSGHENNKAKAKADNEAIEAGTYVG